MSTDQAAHRTASHIVKPMTMSKRLFLDFNQFGLTYTTSSGVSAAVNTDALVNGGIVDFEGVTYLAVTLHTGAPDINGMSRLNLAHLTNLHALKFDVMYDAQNNEGVLDVWKGILGIVRTIPETTQLSRFVLCSPITLTVLRSGWARSPFVAELGRVTWNVDARLKRLVDGAAPIEAVMLVPPKGEGFASGDWLIITRIFFPALYGYDMVEF